jgi:hypothetical protein
MPRRQCPVQMHNPDIDFRLDVDFRAALRHKLMWIGDMAGEPYHMDTNDFDKQAHAHLNFYHGFMNGSKIVVVLVILTLVIMAATLL